MIINSQWLAMLALLLAISGWPLPSLALDASAAAPDLFPRPAALAPALRFWTRIYGELDADSGLIHDNRHLDIIYQPLFLNPGATLEVHQRTIEQTLDEYRTSLQRLAAGERDPQDPHLNRLLTLWGADAPAEVYQAASERLRFQRGQVDRLRSGLQRAAPWQPRIERILRQRDLPLGLSILPHIESSYNPQAVSKVGAGGLWQLMPDTARRYLRVDDEVDERFDVLKSTVAAANLLQHNYSVLGHWPLAITAYNHGLSGVRRGVRETGSHDIAVIVEHYRGPRFGFASRNFYVAFVATLDLIVQLEHTPLGPPIPPALTSLTAPAFLPARPLGQWFDLSLAQLRALNPHIHYAVWNENQLIASGTILHLPAPQGRAQSWRKLNQFAQHYGFNAQLPLNYYEVRSGDSLSGIALRHNTSVQTLMRLNTLSSADEMQVGRRLRLPPGALPQPQGEGAAELLSDLLAAAHRPQALPLPAEDAELVRDALMVPHPVEPQPHLAADPVDYSVTADGQIVIQVGETLGHYAQWLETRSAELRRLNQLDENSPLMIGQRLQLSFEQVTVAQFEQQRTTFHRQRQLRYFETNQIIGVRAHPIAEAQTLWLLAQQHQIPLWLLHQYNPDLDMNAILPAGSLVDIPQIVPRLSQADAQRAP